MDLVTLIALCSLASTSSTNDLAHRIALSNDADVFRIDDLTQGNAYNPNTIDEAKGMTVALLERGHDVRVGLLLVPARTAVEQFGWNADQLFEPCSNVAIGTELLELTRKKSKHNSKRLSYYLFGNRTEGLDWAGYVLTFDAIGFVGGERKPSPVFQVQTPSLFVFKPKTDVKPKEKKASKTPALNLSSKTQRPKRAKSTTRKTKHIPQPDVTSERLPTTADLKRGNP